ncbi:MAG: HEAT repeat domain-containing protein [Candidatus Omnitrophota bacterium]
MDRIDGEVTPRLSPSILRSFVDYEIVGKTGDPRIQEKARDLETKRLKISKGKEELAKRWVTEVKDSLGLGDGIVFLIGGDVAFGMSHDKKREERSTCMPVNGSDLDILVIIDEALFEKSPQTEIDRRLYDIKWNLLKNFQEEVDFIIKPLSKIYQYWENFDPKDTIAVKIIFESKLLCGDEKLYAQVKSLLSNSQWQDILDSHFQAAGQRRCALIREVLRLPVVKWDARLRKEFVGEEGDFFAETDFFISAKEVFGFAQNFKSTNLKVSRLLKRYARALKTLEEYLALSGKIIGPPDKIKVACYDTVSKEIVFNLPQEEAIAVLKENGFIDAEEIWSFVCNHEKLHKEKPALLEKNILEIQAKDLMLSVLSGSTSFPSKITATCGNDGFVFKQWEKKPQCLANGMFGSLANQAGLNLASGYAEEINSKLNQVKKKLLTEDFFREEDFNVLLTVVFPAYKSATFHIVKDKKHEIILDWRCFGNDDFLYLVIKHELTDIKLNTIIPDIDPALRELFTLITVNIDGVMKLRDEHPLKAKELLQFCHKVANTQIGLFPQYEKVLNNSGLDNPFIFIREICRLLTQETTYFPNMRHRAQALLEGEHFRFEILEYRLRAINKKLFESYRIIGDEKLELLSSFSGEVPAALKAFMPYAENVQYKIEGDNIFLKVKFIDDSKRIKFAYLYLGLNDNLDLTLGKSGKMFSLTYENWQKSNPGLFQYQYEDMEKEKRIAWSNLKRLPLTQMIEKINQHNLNHASRGVKGQLKDLFEQLFAGLRIEAPLSSKTWLSLERRVGRNKAPGAYYVIRNQFINDYLNKIFPKLFLGEVSVTLCPVKDLPIWPVTDNSHMKSSLLNWLSTNKIRGQPSYYLEAEKISISTLLYLLFVPLEKNHPVDPIVANTLPTSPIISNSVFHENLSNHLFKLPLFFRKNFINGQSWKYGIDPKRFSPEDYKEIIENRERAEPDGRPLAVLLYPSGTVDIFIKHDFTHDLIMHNYRVMYYAVDSVIDLICYLEIASDKQQASIIMIGGHGSQQGIALGRMSLRRSHYPLFSSANLSGTLKEGGVIVLESCLTGKGAEGADNIANMFFKVWEEVDPVVFSATGSFSKRELIFGEKGDVVNVEFSRTISKTFFKVFLAGLCSVFFEAINQVIHIDEFGLLVFMPLIAILLLLALQFLSKYFPRAVFWNVKTYIKSAKYASQAAAQPASKHNGPRPSRAIDALLIAVFWISSGIILGLAAGLVWSVPLFINAAWNLIKAIDIIQAFLRNPKESRAPPLTTAIANNINGNITLHPLSNNLIIYSPKFHEELHNRLTKLPLILQEFIIHSIDFVGLLKKILAYFPKISFKLQDCFNATFDGLGDSLIPVFAGLPNGSSYSYQSKAEHVLFARVGDEDNRIKPVERISSIFPLKAKKEKDAFPEDKNSQKLRKNELGGDINEQGKDVYIPSDNGSCNKLPDFILYDKRGKPVYLGASNQDKYPWLSSLNIFPSDITFSFELEVLVMDQILFSHPELLELVKLERGHKVLPPEVWGKYWDEFVFYLEKSIPFGWWIEKDIEGRKNLIEIKVKEGQFFSNVDSSWGQLYKDLNTLQRLVPAGFYSMHMHISRKSALKYEQLVIDEERLGRVVKVYEALWRALVGMGWSKLKDSGCIGVMDEKVIGNDVYVLSRRSIINKSHKHPTVEVKILTGLLNKEGKLDIDNFQRDIRWVFSLFQLLREGKERLPLVVLGAPILAGDKPSEKQIERFLELIFGEDEEGSLIARQNLDLIKNENPGLPASEKNNAYADMVGAYIFYGLGLVYKLHRDHDGYDENIIKHLLEPGNLKKLASDIISANKDSKYEALRFFPIEMRSALIKAIKVAVLEQSRHSITAQSQFNAALKFKSLKREFSYLGEDLRNICQYLKDTGKITGPPGKFNASTFELAYHRNGKMYWAQNLTETDIRNSIKELSLQDRLKLDEETIISQIKTHELCNTHDKGIAAQQKLLISQKNKTLPIDLRPAADKTKIQALPIAKHGEICAFVEEYARNYGQKLLIINFDAHNDKWEVVHQEDRIINIDASWAKYLEENNLAYVIHVPYWRNQENIKKEILEAIKQSGSQLGEIWFTFDFDFFSFGEIDFDEGDYYSRTVYHMEEMEIREVLESIADFFIQNKIDIGMIIPCESREYLALSTFEFKLEAGEMVIYRSLGKPSLLNAYCSMVMNCIISIFGSARQEKDYTIVKDEEYSVNPGAEWPGSIITTGTTFHNQDDRMPAMVGEVIAQDIKDNSRVLEIGTGSGVLLLWLASLVKNVFNYKGVKFLGTDINEDAISDSQKNLVGFEDIEIRKSNLFEGLGNERFDIIFFNPPWFSGKKIIVEQKQLYRCDFGYYTLRRFIKDVWDHLNPAGKVYLIFPRNNSKVLKDLADEFSLEISEASHYATKNNIIYIYQVSRQISVNSTNKILKSACFVCEHCKKPVYPLEVSRRDHCPYCLYSKHLDAVMPADGASSCTGLMRPVDIKCEKNKWYISYRCLKCGTTKKFLMAEDDSAEMKMNLSRPGSKLFALPDSVGTLVPARSRGISSLEFSKNSLCIYFYRRGERAVVKDLFDGLSDGLSMRVFPELGNIPVFNVHKTREILGDIYIGDLRLGEPAKLKSGELIYYLDEEGKYLLEEIQSNNVWIGTANDAEPSSDNAILRIEETNEALLKKNCLYSYLVNAGKIEAAENLLKNLSASDVVFFLDADGKSVPAFNIKKVHQILPDECLKEIYLKKSGYLRTENGEEPVYHVHKKGNILMEGIYDSCAWVAGNKFKEINFKNISTNFLSYFLPVFLPLVLFLSSLYLLASPFLYKFSGLIFGFLMFSAGAGILLGLFYTVENVKILLGHKPVGFGAGEEIDKLTSQEKLALIKLADQSYEGPGNKIKPSFIHAVAKIFSLRGFILILAGGLATFALFGLTNWFTLVLGALFATMVPYLFSVIYNFIYSYVDHYKFRSEFIKQYLNDKRIQNTLVEDLAKVKPTPKFLLPFVNLWGSLTLRFPVLTGLAVFILVKVQIIFWANIVGLAILPFIGIDIANYSLLAGFYSFAEGIKWEWGYAFSLNLMNIFSNLGIVFTLGDLVRLALIALSLGVLTLPGQLRKFGLISFCAIIINILFAPAAAGICFYFFPIIWLLSFKSISFSKFKEIVAYNLYKFWNNFIHVWLIVAIIGTISPWNISNISMQVPGINYPQKLHSYAGGKGDVAVWQKANLLYQKMKINPESISGMDIGEDELELLLEQFKVVDNTSIQEITKFRLNVFEGHKTGIVFMEDSDRPFVRQFCIFILGQMNTPRAQEIISQYLDDRDSDVRTMAIVCQSKNGDKKAISLLGKSSFYHGGWAQQQAILNLSGLDLPWATSFLLSNLRTYSYSDVRYTAVAALVDKIDRVEVKNAFINLLKSDPSSQVRRQVAFSLSDINDLKIKNALTIALDDTDPQVKEAAILSLAPQADIKIMEKIKPFLSDSNLTLQKAAILSVGSRLNDFPNNLSLLVPGLINKDLEIRATTISVLGPSINKFPELKQPFLDIAKNNTQPIEFRQDSITYLSKLETPEIKTFLVDNLNDSDWKIRQPAVFGLGNFKSPEIPELLKPLVKDSAWQVRESTAISLGKYDKPDIVKSLVPLLRDNNTSVRQAAILSLGDKVKLYSQLTDEFTNILKTDDDSWNRQLSAFSLQSINTPKVTELKPLIQQNVSGVRVAIISPGIDDFDPRTPGRALDQDITKDWQLRKILELGGVKVIEHRWPGRLWEMSAIQRAFDATELKGLSLAGEKGSVLNIGYSAGNIVNERLSAHIKPGMNTPIAGAIKEGRIKIVSLNSPSVYDFSKIDPGWKNFWAGNDLFSWPSEAISLNKYDIKYNYYPDVVRDVRELHSGYKDPRVISDIVHQAFPNLSMPQLDKMLTQQNTSSWKYFPTNGSWPSQYNFKSVAPTDYWKQQQFQQSNFTSPKYLPPPSDLFKMQPPINRYQSPQQYQRPALQPQSPLHQPVPKYNPPPSVNFNRK